MEFSTNDHSYNILLNLSIEEAEKLYIMLELSCDGGFIDEELSILRNKLQNHLSSQINQKNH